MRRYQPDPKRPRRLTKDEERRLEAAPIDYSDIPPLGDEFFANAKQPRPARCGDDMTGASPTQGHRQRPGRGRGGV